MGVCTKLHVGPINLLLGGGESRDTDSACGWMNHRMIVLNGNVREASRIAKGDGTDLRPVDPSRIIYMCISTIRLWAAAALT